MALLGPYPAYGIGDHVPLAWIFAENNVNVDKALGIGEGKRTPELRFEHAKNSGVGTDAQGERENDDEGEAAILAEDASSVAKIAQESLDKGQAFSFAPGFFSLLEAAELEEGLAAGFFCAHTCAQIVFDVELEMALQFGGEFAFAAGLAEEVGESDEPCT